MRYLYCFFVMFFFLVVDIKAQDENEPEKNEETLSLNIRSLNFFRNNEYSNSIGGPGFNLAGELPLYADKSLWIEGYTLTGFFFRPELVYKPAVNIALRAGGHFQKYWGSGRFDEIRPLFSTSVGLSPNTTLTLGSLSGSDEHRMFDPHFNSERLYSNYAEDGLQITTNSDRIFNDAWISWENFIFKGDNEREIFTAGESFRYNSPVIMEYLNIELPLQIQFKHYGGQISSYPEKVITFFNLAAGGRVNIDTRKFGVIGAEYTGFFNKVIPSADTYSISQGKAHWLRLHYNLKGFYLGASYWLADDFYAPNGNGIFASIFVFDSDYVIHERKIITGAASISLFPEDNLELYLGIEAFYDRCAGRLDHAATLHLDFGKIFRLR